MPIGDDATAAGYPLVPDDESDEARVRWGAREINRTRDFIALVKALIPTGKAGFRSSSGISSGTAEPSGGNDGDIYFKIV
jgi:hypothetical protein